MMLRFIIPFPLIMLVLPIPMIVALLLGLFSVKAWLNQHHSKFIPILLAACTLQAVIISLSQHYGIHELQRLQPITGTMLPPLTWIALQATAIRPLAIWRDAVHLTPVILSTCALFFIPSAVDVIVIGTFLFYGALLLYRLRLGLDGLPQLQLQDGELPRYLWKTAAYALLLIATSDALIALAAHNEAIWIKPWIISLFSALALLGIGLLGIVPGMRDSHVAQSAPELTLPDEAEPAMRETDDSSKDAEYMEKLELLLAQQPLYLEPSLTLARLSRRLGIPSKLLSAAINRSKNENVSRFINRYRIRHACERLRAGDSVTEAMLASGFNTKSNFNREFKRITDQAPSKWLELNSATY